MRERGHGHLVQVSSIGGIGAPATPSGSRRYSPRGRRRRRSGTVLPAMRAAGAGSLLFTTGSAALHPNAGSAAAFPTVLPRLSP